jgi:hypothetical protein
MIPGLSNVCDCCDALLTDEEIEASEYLGRELCDACLRQVEQANAPYEEDGDDLIDMGRAADFIYNGGVGRDE